LSHNSIFKERYVKTHTTLLRGARQIRQQRRINPNRTADYPTDNFCRLKRLSSLVRDQKRVKNNRVGARRKQNFFANAVFQALIQEGRWGAGGVVSGLPWGAIGVSLKAIGGQSAGRFARGCRAADKRLPGGGARALAAGLGV
jgi:hypothetical protein